MPKKILSRFSCVAMLFLLGTAESADIKASNGSGGSSYTPPTAQEMSPMRSGYLAELAKIHEPPEMASKSMQVRKPVSSSVLKLRRIFSAIPDTEKATHEQRLLAIRDLLEIVNTKELGDGVDRSTTYSDIASIACIDGSDPQSIVGFASNAIGDRDDAIALRARMYMKAGDREKALNDLETIMASGDGAALSSGGVDPRKESNPCGWSIADFDALGDDPRALAAKGLYLSSFLRFGAGTRGTVRESNVRDLYKSAGKSWHSPIPRMLDVAMDGHIGGSQRMNDLQCIRGISGGMAVPDPNNACTKSDDGTQREIRDLTMALAIQPTSARALSMRAEKYMRLAQAYYADGKPSRQLFDLAIKDYTAAIAAGGEKHALYCDQAIALALIGRYKDAATGYVQGMKYAKGGIEESPFVYQQLAGVYMKLGQFNDAANLLTLAIIHTTGGGMDAVIFQGGIKGFRTLYPEYALLPDEILAEEVRRRYEPQLPQSWEADFISNGGVSSGKIASSILPELYVVRGDAYMKAGRRAEALADYRRVKSDAWFGEEQYLPKNLYFEDGGRRNYELPQIWPPSQSLPK